ncbi:MAG: hypothetical protein AAFP19_10930 [Bacteroidota bacterium]
MLLLDICTECTWQIVPMLLGSWLLGWLFWWLFNKKALQDKINLLEKDLDIWKSKSNKLEADLSTAYYNEEKTKKELVKVKGKLGDVELKLRACEEASGDT